jgi:DNA repair photolyase
MKKWGKQPVLHFDEKELKTNLGSGNFIFVGSSCDMFAENVPDDWIKKTLRHVRKYPYTKFLFQSKNPERMLRFIAPADTRFVLCTTIETNRVYGEFMGTAPSPIERVSAFDKWYPYIPLHVTIEPIMDFDLDEFVSMLWELPVYQINIGADSGNNKLPEPSPEKIAALIEALRRFTDVHLKKNLKRLYKETA